MNIFKRFFTKTSNKVDVEEPIYNSIKILRINMDQCLTNPNFNPYYFYNLPEKLDHTYHSVHEIRLISNILTSPDPRDRAFAEEQLKVFRFYLQHTTINPYVDKEVTLCIPKILENGIIKPHYLENVTNEYTDTIELYLDGTEYKWNLKHHARGY